ncbi:MAG: glycosyltransferase family 4 protein [Candidatus Moranbacteria bacterium]|nr:glycosyltransferase family 4 protein [Candidatus Moranbacteria bacterium]
MKIGIDIRCLTDGKRTGVEEYTMNLLENLFELDKKNQYILFLNSYRDSHFDARIFAHFKNVRVKRFNYPNKLLNFCFWYLRWPHVDQMLGGVDLFFMPNINFVALSRQAKLVLTVHDLSYEIFPETFSLKRRAWHHFINPRSLCKRADEIVAVSNSTRNDIISHYRIHPDKVRRIYNGVAQEMEQLDRNDQKLIEVKEKYHLPFNFILFLGTIEPRKNITAIVKAFDHLRSLRNPQLDKYKLVIAGGKGWKVDSILDAARKANFTNDIIFTSCIINDDKAAVYTLASLFVYPSFFEGFGIPVLEAMRCGVPVITSNCSSLPEVVAGGAVMIDPDKPEELYLAMKEVLLNREFHSELTAQGLRQAIRFNWRTCARETLAIFEKLKG